MTSAVAGAALGVATVACAVALALTDGPVSGATVEFDKVDRGPKPQYEGVAPSVMVNVPMTVFTPAGVTAWENTTVNVL